MDKEKRDREEPEEEGKKKTSFGRGCGITLLNLLGMVLIGIVLVWVALLALNKYTHHGEAVRVPDLAGMSLEEATENVRPLDLTLEIVDSIYTEGMPPGAILRTSPAVGSIIKKHRTLFLTTNTTMVEQIVVPSIYDSSRRRAEAALRSAGFIDISVKAVPGRYNDLAVEVLDRTTGRVLQPGTEVPYNTPITLTVTSTTSLDSLYNADSTVVEDQIVEALREQGGTEEEPDDLDLPEL